MDICVSNQLNKCLMNCIELAINNHHGRWLSAENAVIVNVVLLKSFDNYWGHRVALRFENDRSDKVLAAVKDSDIALVIVITQLQVQH